MTRTFNFTVEDPESVPLRDAATVMLVRDGRSGVEVFMLRRNLNSDFVGGAYVFPGGAVDDEDGSPEIEPLSAGLTDAQASALLEVERGGLAYWVAAIRESFEEAGLLLALDEHDSIVRFEDATVIERFARHRIDVDTSARPLRDIIRDERLRLATAEIHYFSRWITPLGSPRRYDTRFFVAHAPEAQVATHDDRETIANVWIRPHEALERFEAGEFELIFPTVRSLEALARFTSAEAVVAHAQSIPEFPAVLPRVLEEDGGVRIVLPGDEVYDAFTAKRLR
ncbi:MAG: NUDIX domain-containing protein [Actinobacteria bacterium]|nr:NUDIX domain-containing protein [Actinomycetota bacterium]